MLIEVGGDLYFFIRAFCCSFWSTDTQRINRYPKNVFGEESSAELDEESLFVLTRMGLVKTEVIYGLISWLFEQAGVLESAFVERRLRLLIDCNPSVLINSNISGCSLLNSFQEYDYSLSVIKSVGVMILETILELGIIHFPAALGFAFHEFNFHSLCGSYGRERVHEIFRHKLIGTLRQNSSSSNNNNNIITLKTLVFAAATNKNISLDGVYTLVRCDPVALLTESSKISGNSLSPSTPQLKNLSGAA
jgi:hypothetical protein